MKLQLLSDLHLESEAFDPQPAPGAELLVLAGDIDSGWTALERFSGWPRPVLFVPGNHEFDRRDVDAARSGLRARCRALGLTLLDDDSALHVGADGRRVRFLGSTRWCDFDLFGPARRDKAMRAATYFVRVMQATRGGAPFDPAAVREVALASRAWLGRELARTGGDWDATVVVTHYAPSLSSADPRYGTQPTTASFCNADDDLLALADVWLHGHLHCRHDYALPRAGGGATRVVCNARGLDAKGEPEGYDPFRLIDV